MVGAIPYKGGTYVELRDTHFFLSLPPSFLLFFSFKLDCTHT
jgi:hypothetical protein